MIVRMERLLASNLRVAHTLTACILIASPLEVFGQQPYISEPENEMPCITITCAEGYQHKWNAKDLRCPGACVTKNDTEACCDFGRFFSFSWRILASSNVTGLWEISKVVFKYDDNCSDASEVETAAAVHHKWRHWPNGAAFSHNAGHGTVAARAFAPDPVPTPRNLQPVRETWNSGGSCDAGSCWLGFKWDSDIDRAPVGLCTAKFGAPCTSMARPQSAGHIRVGCAEVQQGASPGSYAEELELQFLDVTGLSLNSTNDPRGVWRTAALAKGLTGGKAYISMSDSASP